MRLILLFIALCFSSSLLPENQSATSIFPQQYIERVPALKEALLHLFPNEEEVTFKLLVGGMTTSKVFTLESPSKKVVIKLLPHRYSLSMRRQEITAHQRAADLDLAPKVLYVDADSTILCMSFIEGNILSSKDLKKKETIKRLGAMLRKLHQSKDDFPYKRPQEYIASKYFQRAYQRRVALPEEYPRIYEQYLGERPNCEKLVFSHGDLNFTNIMVTKDKIYFIDWAAATMADPYEDLAYLSFLNNFNQKQVRTFLKAYRNREPLLSELLRLDFAQKRICFLTAAVWLNFSESVQKRELPMGPRRRRLNSLFNYGDLQSPSEYIKNRSFVSPTSGQYDEIQTLGLSFLKAYRDWGKRDTSKKKM